MYTSNYNYSHFLTFWNPVVRLAMDFFCAAFLVGLRKTSNFGSSTVRRDRLLRNGRIQISEIISFFTFLVAGCKYGTLQLESETFVFACPSLLQWCTPSNHKCFSLEVNLKLVLKYSNFSDKSGVK